MIHQQNPKDSVLIVGPGAVGSVLGVMLQSHFEVSFQSRTERIQHSVTIDRKEYEFKRCLTQSPDYVMICTKAYDFESAVNRQLSTATARTTVIPFCNGWIIPIINKLEQKWPGHNFLTGICTIGVKQLPVENTAQGRNQLTFETTAGKFFYGPLNPDEPTCSQHQELSSANADIVYAKDIVNMARIKWVNNCSLNYTALIQKCRTNGEVLNHLEALKAEYVLAYKTAQKLWPQDKNFDPENFDKGFDNLIRLIENTSTNENSMVKDQRLGKKLETAYLNGMYRTTNV